MAQKKLVLIDGHALAHRAYHALPATLATSKGELTNATYGFTSMLLKVLEEEKPDYIAVAFDRGHTFRHQQYKGYKAHRAKTPEEFNAQMKRIRELIEAFNIPIFAVEGYEADDVLGTLAKQAEEKGVATLIVTGDTDAFQLIDAHTQVLTSRRQFSDTEVYDEEGIRKRYGLEPKQLIDYKGLIGDASDNIPGVRGVGDKTASRLLQRYGSLEEIYAHLDEIESDRFRNALAEGRESAFLSKELATIVTDVSIELDLEACRTSDYDRERVMELFRELEFRSLVNKLPESRRQAQPAKRATVLPVQYQTVNSEEDLERLVAKLSAASAFAFDVEATDVDAMAADLVGLAVSNREGEAYYIPVGHAPAPQKLLLDVAKVTGDSEVNLPWDHVLARLGPLLADEKIAKYAHNSDYDITVLTQHGAEVKGLAFDTMIAEWLIDPASRNLGLKNLAWVKLGVEMKPITDLIGKGREQLTIAQVPISKVAPYAGADVDMTYRLVKVLEPELRRRELWKLFTEVEMPLVPVLADMEMSGVALDVEYLKGMSRGLYLRLQELEKEIYQIAGYAFNVNSTQQLGEVLFEKLGLPVVRRTKTGYSTASDVLEQLQGQHEIIDFILEYRHLSKLKSTYVDALPLLVNRRTGRVHTSYNQTGTVTGRISSSNPNLQNIPIRTEIGRQVRRAFIAKEGCLLLSADYSQVELRILAHITQDPNLLAAFRRGEDIHASTAAAILGVPLEGVTPEMRRLAKTINFGITYGMSDYGLAQRTGLSQEEASRFIANYFAQYPEVKGYVEGTKRQAAEQGYVETLLGRRRYFPELKADSKAHGSVKRAAEREAINMPIQGCLPWSTRILTSSGYMPIGELWDLGSKRPPYVWDGSQWVTYEVLDRGPAELAEIELANGQVLQCDVRHEVLIVDDNGYRWCQFDQLKPGTKVCCSLPRSMEFQPLPEFQFEYRSTNPMALDLSVDGLGQDFWYWLGYYYGDGHIWQRGDYERYDLSIAFGVQREDQADRCVEFFRTLGLNPRKYRVEVAEGSGGTRQKLQVVVTSQGLGRLFQELGIKIGTTAHTKRLPDRIFRERLDNRREFVRGLMDADGSFGSDTRYMPNLHLCQRSLLEGMQLLLKTLGIESRLRGPYRYRGLESYRLDIRRRALLSALGEDSAAYTRVNTHPLPDFLKRELAARYPDLQRRFFQRRSDYVVYRRWLAGGSSSVYHFAEWLDRYGLTLDSPIYTWQEVHETRRLGRMETTYTLSVNSDRHRFDSEGVISKNTAADIIKLAMIRLDRVLKERGLASKMTLQVHDELVLEVPEEELDAVMPLAHSAMEGAFTLAAPLKMDMKVGKNWEEMIELNRGGNK